MRSFLIILMTTLLSGCVIGYSSPQASFDIEVETSEATELTFEFLTEELGRLGYVQDRTWEEAEPPLGPMPQWFLLRKHFYYAGETTSNRDNYSISVELPGDQDFKSFAICCTVNVRVSESRPGGFSPAGHSFYANLINSIEGAGYRIVKQDEPPPTDNAEYWRVNSMIAGTISFWWLVAWSVFMLLFGELGLFIGRRKFKTLKGHRFGVWLAGVLLATPMPLPSMFMVFPIPNAIGFPFLFAPEMWGHFAWLMVPSFVASTLLSWVYAIFRVRTVKLRGKQSIA
ncbi:hypothetical protein [Ponticaulis sp.]|uniref:hypothetical protein n=1 Tax=Ponticaulis sp. TaxID=2020902 RepID=UPI00262E45E4|nr:hypothetical protein [Ponticaulis sp.]MDF1681748.1 hypothetical protein [Ponticaulis sp.]